ncbi:MAG: MBL fold metallo-hydrolase, partial [Gemmatimonadetes bacterium]|nr:MBL fold metallo-hydrolase [Gemmatimonadota bacterium]
QWQASLERNQIDITSVHQGYLLDLGSGVRVEVLDSRTLLPVAGAIVRLKGAYAEERLGRLADLSTPRIQRREYQLTAQTGRDGVVVVEAFGSDAGARWMAEQAMRLAGRAPTHVVLTHFHRDHTGGLRGATALSDPEILATPVTRDLVLARNENVPSAILDRVRELDTIRPTEIDLGDRSITVVPRRGHTASDVTVEISDPSIVFCGDLVWNQMFPNYVDAIPSRLTQAVRLIRAGNHSTYVPGHGPLADAAAIDRYVGLLDDVEAKARRAIERGITPEQAAAQYRLPPMALGWTSFSDSYFATALGAWMRELGVP